MYVFIYSSLLFITVLLNISFCFMCLGVLYIFICVPHLCLAPGVQKRASVPLELELQMGCELLWVLGIEYGTSAGAARAHDC